MKLDAIDLRCITTRSVTKKLKKWVEPDREMLALIKKDQIKKRKMIKIKKLLPKQFKRLDGKIKPLKFKINS
jgi:hypothetical protein